MAPRHKSRKCATSPSNLPRTTSLSRDRRRLRPFTGQNEKLVLSIDIGTTFSAASYCVLRPRSVPNLEIVSSWPGQVTPDFKVPSILYYDQHGGLRAWGAEIIDPEVKHTAAQENWIRVEWFKLSLRPAHLPPMSLPSCDDTIMVATIPPLPIFVTPHRVYTDFLKCILDHIRASFCKAYSLGSELWQKLYPTMDVVFTIPSGWEMKQQYEIRAAAVDSGFMGPVVWGLEEALPEEVLNGAIQRDTLLEEALERISFTSEPEAAVVYAADSGYIDSWIQAGQDVILCDAGGGTIDITTYTVIKNRPLELKEKYAPKCVIAGAILVNNCAKNYITNMLDGTAWDVPGRIEQIMDEFENDTKKRFNSPFREYGIGKGENHEFIMGSSVRGGRLYIPGNDLEKFFEPTLSSIKAELTEIHEKSSGQTKNVIMVGGLMNSGYAYDHLQVWGENVGLRFAKPDGVLAKAISHGALLWYLTKPVKRYILKAHYGIEASLMVCDVAEEDLVNRNIVMESDGSVIVDGGWSTIATMGEELSPRVEIVADYERYIDFGDGTEAFRFEEKLYLSRAKEPPTFLALQSGDLTPQVEHICSIVVDLEDLYHSMSWEISKKTGKRFKKLEFIVAIKYDGHGLTAYAYWVVKGVKTIGEAKVVLPGIS